MQGLLMLAKSKQYPEKSLPLEGRNEAQCIKWQADFAEAKASCNETISANRIFTHLWVKNRQGQIGGGLRNVASRNRECLTIAYKYKTAPRASGCCGLKHYNHTQNITTINTNAQFSRCLGC